ncbi:hypothetical protein MRX96_055055 [Rhipicephalus microplus]
MAEVCDQGGLSRFQRSGEGRLDVRRARKRTKPMGFKKIEWQPQQRTRQPAASVRSPVGVPPPDFLADVHGSGAVLGRAVPVSFSGNRLGRPPSLLSAGASPRCPYLRRRGRETEACGGSCNQHRQTDMYPNLLERAGGLDAAFF